MKKLKVLIVLLIIVLIALLCACKKVFDGTGEIHGETNSRDHTFYNRAFDYADKHLEKPIWVFDEGFNITFGKIIRGNKQDSASYEESNHLKEKGQAAFDAVYYDVKNDTSFINTHWLSFKVGYVSEDFVTGDKTIYRYPLSMFH